MKEIKSKMCRTTYQTEQMAISSKNQNESLSLKPFNAKENNNYPMLNLNNVDNSASIKYEVQKNKTGRRSYKKRKQNRKKKYPSITVQHSYHDHVNDPVAVTLSEEMNLTDDNFNEVFSYSLKPSRGHISEPFPVKLYKMLDEFEKLGYNHIISWQPHGRCFVIHETKLFNINLLPTYFKLNKVASFQRQLNLYGFKRLTIGNDKNGYYNEKFLRGRIDLAYTINRVKVKGTGIRAKSNPEQEPDFWNSIRWNVTQDAILNHQYNIAFTENTNIANQENESFNDLMVTHQQEGNDSISQQTSVNDQVPDYRSKSDYDDSKELHLGNFYPSNSLISLQAATNLSNRYKNDNFYDEKQCNFDWQTLSQPQMYVNSMSDEKPRHSESTATNITRLNDVDFDILVDELFESNGDLEFSDLLEKATKSVMEV